MSVAMSYSPVRAMCWRFIARRAAARELLKLELEL
jgi:hypothetical protein